MKAHTVHKFYVCELTGAAIVEASFSYGERETAYVRPFTTADNARAHVHREKQDWFIAVLTKWIAHKKHIIEAHAQRDPEKVKALEVCEQALKYYNQAMLKKMCGDFLKGIVWFERILPAMNNSSYESSKQALDCMKEFCIHETEQKQHA